MPLSPKRPTPTNPHENREMKSALDLQKFKELQKFLHPEDDEPSSPVPDNKSDSPIRIKYAQLIKGKYDWSYQHGRYMPNVNGQEQQMIKLQFNLNQGEDLCYVSWKRENGFLGGDIQHTTTREQCTKPIVFFFPLQFDAPLDQIRIFGFKKNVMISKSEPIRECIATTQRVIECMGEEKAQHVLQNDIVTLEEVAKLNNGQLKDFINLKISTNASHQDRLFPAMQNHPDKEIPDAYLCLITREIMKKPVICTLDGKTYEEAAIRKWLQDHRSSPHNRALMKPDQAIDQVLVRNRNLEEAIESFCQAKQQDSSKLNFSQP